METHIAALLTANIAILIGEFVVYNIYDQEKRATLQWRFQIRVCAWIGTIFLYKLSLIVDIIYIFLIDQPNSGLILGLVATSIVVSLVALISFVWDVIPR